MKQKQENWDVNLNPNGETDNEEMDNEKVDTHTDPDEKPNEQSIEKDASRLMKANYIKKIYRTDDGNWFTDVANAETNAKKTGGEVKTYELNEKTED